MKTIKTLLAASVLLAAGAVSAAPTLIPLTATLNSQTGRTIGGTDTFTGSINVDLLNGDLYGLVLVNDGNLTATSASTVVTYFAGSEWSWLYTRTPNVTGVIPVGSFGSDGGTGFIATYTWGSGVTPAQDSNGGGDFDASGASSGPSCSGGLLVCAPELAADPGWDVVTLTVYLDSGLNVTSAVLQTTETRETGVGPLVSSYSLVP